VDDVLAEEMEDWESQDIGRSPSSSSIIVRGGRAGGGVLERVDLEEEIMCRARLRELGDSSFSTLLTFDLDRVLCQIFSANELARLNELPLLLGDGYPMPNAEDPLMLWLSRLPFDRVRREWEPLERAVAELASLLMPEKTRGSPFGGGVGGTWSCISSAY
jgi:hypothetical protein